MAPVSNLLNQKQVFSVSPYQSVLEAANLMVEHGIGAVPVLKDGSLVGIFSERDLLNRVIHRELSPATTLVGEVMSVNITTVKPTDTIEHCMDLMREHNVRHLPVVNWKRLVGFLSIRDLLMYDVNEKNMELRMIRAYTR
jgi:CBS domain-containing protein